MPETLDRTRFELEFDEDFAGDALDTRRWIAHYLPQWTTPERSAARYELPPGLLRLRIDADQPAWRVEDGEMRVSNLQTGTFSGPAGSSIGQHRHRPDLTVATPQPKRRLYTPRGGLAEAVMRATSDPTCMLAFWLVGFEASPAASGEICVAELFGNAVGPERSRVRVGVKAHNDPRLHVGHGRAGARPRRHGLAHLRRRVDGGAGPLLRRRPARPHRRTSGSTIRCS